MNFLTYKKCNTHIFFKKNNTPGKENIYKPINKRNLNDFFGKYLKLNVLISRLLLKKYRIVDFSTHYNGFVKIK